MSAICPHCGKTLGCACQIRTALSGERCCSFCVGEVNKIYNEKRFNGVNPYKKDKPINMNRRNLLI